MAATLDLKEITLLSIEEAKLAEQNVPDILNKNSVWWLRSPGAYGDLATCVLEFGGIVDYGVRMDLNYGVLPALRIDNLKSNHLQIGDKIQIASRSWTVISDDLVLCDKIIKREPFNRDKTRGNDYESSHIKEFLDKWDMWTITENGCTFEVFKFS